VLDASTGNVISSYPPAQRSTGTTSAQTQNAGMSFMDSLSGGPNGQAIPSVTESIWSSDGTQIISAMQGQTLNSAASVVVWNASTGALIRTAVTFGPDRQFIGLNSGLGQGAISSNGKYVAVQAANNSIEIWSIATGKQVSTLPYNQQQISALAWSPDSSSLALGLTNASDVQTWSVASGQLTTTFHDRDSANTFIGALAWSPDGKYLAESASDIHIWDVSEQKIVATFGQVAQNQWIATLTWSPDSSMLASTYNNDNKGGDRTQNTGDIWKLS
jgi:WD40 repeat protein